MRHPIIGQTKPKQRLFFCTVPAGLTAYEQDAWIYYGGGLPLWHELYAPFNLIAFPAGNTGAQMGGWFRREIRDVRDVKGLKMRIPGLAGEVMAHMGAIPQTIPSTELFTAIQSGLIDALEWIGPWNDLALGFYKAAPYYYGPGLHEAGATLECMINRTAYEGLSRELQRVIKTACAVENQLMQSQYYANNLRAYSKMRDELKVDIRRFPDDFQQQFFYHCQRSQQQPCLGWGIGKKNPRQLSAISATIHCLWSGCRIWLFASKG